MKKFKDMTAEEKKAYINSFVEEVEDVVIEEEIEEEEEVNPNVDSDLLHIDVLNKLNEIYKYKNSCKYYTIYLENGKELQLRVGNHSGMSYNNAKNISADYFVNVIICNYDVTANRCHAVPNDLEFTSENSVNEIVNKIVNLVNSYEFK